MINGELVICNLSDIYPNYKDDLLIGEGTEDSQMTQVRCFIRSTLPYMVSFLPGPIHQVQGYELR